MRAKWLAQVPLALAFAVSPAFTARAEEGKEAGAENHEIRLAMATAHAGSPTAAPDAGAMRLTERERYLLERLEQLERRVADLESRLGRASEASGVEIAAAQPMGAVRARAPLPPAVAGPARAPQRTMYDFFRETTLNVTLDGYYGYNFNRPVGRVNLLRAYDVLSNSFSLNQAAVVIERTATRDPGRRLGLRLDLQYGQATETMQGSAASELRPQAYRPIFQAYGTYVAALGKGLRVDFGKWAGALSVEGNYTKDQINYTRSYFYTFSPFYHLGFRSAYQFNNRLGIEHWLVNGAQQSEDFNGFKSQALLVTLKPARRVSWNLNYYTGIEGRDSKPDLNPGLAALPTQPGLSTEVVHPAPRGRLHIVDSYVLWNTAGRLTLAGQAFYAVNRKQTFSALSRVTGGGVWARYRFTPKLAVAGRGEYLSDRGGLFSGATQALKEITLNTDYQVAEGFLLRSEWRRDFSNQPFFLTHTPGILKREQNTATLGLVWWFGAKQGAW